MTTVAVPDGQPATIPAIHRRAEILPVPAQPFRSECGFTTYARTLATAVCEARNGGTWMAYTRTRYLPHRLVDNRSDVVIVIDDADTRTLIVVASYCPAGTSREQWTIRVNGRTIPHRVLGTELPHFVEPIARSVWRHRIGVPVDGCDNIGCTGPALVATWRQRSMCRPCARRHATTGQ